MRAFFIKVFPWLVTLIALFLAFRGINWQDVYEHVRTGSKFYLSLAVVLTVTSYLIRSFRWIYFFPDKGVSYPQATKVLFLGFFMNNVLPARAGEVVRAHMGSKVTKETRTLVLATIASERLADGLVLSLMFISFALTAASQEMSQALLYVSILFFVVAFSVLVTIIFRNKLFDYAFKFGNKINSRFVNFAVTRLQIFINGLKPLFMPSRFPVLIATSLTIWFVELLVYYLVSKAYGADLSFGQSVLFMVAVNFSSLIPAAPAGIGVIEAVASAILVTIGLDRELALSMVLSQHIIQFVVVGIPGALAMFTWNIRLKQIKELESTNGC
jgi:uncharacterized protein (TIRG00374 family)